MATTTKEKKKRTRSLKLLNLKHRVPHRDAQNRYSESWVDFLAKKVNKAKLYNIRVEIVAVVNCPSVCVVQAKALVGQTVYTYGDYITPLEPNNKHIETLFNAVST